MVKINGRVPEIEVCRSDACRTQYNWLVNDLKSFNRSKTPFLVVIFHSPVYNTYV